MPDHDELEDRLRRAFQWIAGSGEDEADARSESTRVPALPLDIDDEEDGAFIDDESPLRSRRPNRRPLVLAAAMVLLLAAVGVSVGFVVSGTGTSKSPSDHSGTTSAAAARARVVSALGATTAAGNWDISYDYSEVPGSSTTPTTTSPAESCPDPSPPSAITGSGCAVAPSEDTENVSVTGTGVIDVNPKAMVADADPSDFGPVILRIDTTQLWELGTDDGGGLAPSSSDGSAGGQAISGFASLVESTLGTARVRWPCSGSLARPATWCSMSKRSPASLRPDRAPSMGTR